MPFDARDLVKSADGPVRAGGANRGTVRTGLYLYSTTDTHAQVVAANYFNAAARMLSPGDIIMATVNTGATQELRLYVVQTNNGTTVAVAQQSTA